MTRQAMDAEARERIMADPEVLLDDADVMRALARASARAMGPNVVDMRGLAMDRLEARLARLEETHRSVIAAAYDNIAGTNQVHRAVLRLVQAASFEDLAADLEDGVGGALGLGTIRLVLEEGGEAERAAVHRHGGVVRIEEAGFVSGYLGAQRGGPRKVTLRRLRADDSLHGGPLHGGQAESEACLLLDLGPDRPAGLLVLGSPNPQQFAPPQGTDLLAFFAAAFERTLRRVLG